MSLQTLIARIDQNDQGFLVRAPAVGWVSGLPQPGTHIDDRTPMFVLRGLNLRHPVVLPRGLNGWVAEQIVQGTQIAVEYGQPLMRVVRVLDLAADTGDESAPAAGSDQAYVGEISVTAPTGGVFYRRPAADTAPYVEVGSPVTTGSILGLVEVMKCFHQITYGGSALPERGIVARVLVEDAAEVQFGQALFLIKAV